MRARVLVPALLAAIVLTSARAADWPCFRGPNRNGVLAEKLDLLPGGAKKLWEVEVGKGNGGPAIAGGRVFISASKSERGIAWTPGTVSDIGSMPNSSRRTLAHSSYWRIAAGRFPCFTWHRIRAR